MYLAPFVANHLGQQGAKFVRIDETVVRPENAADKSLQIQVRHQFVQFIGAVEPCPEARFGLHHHRFFE